MIPPCVLLQSREPFHVPDTAEWPRLSEALHCFFHANTGRGLTPQNLDYLGRKLLGAGMLCGYVCSCVGMCVAVWVCV